MELIKKYKGVLVVFLFTTLLITFQSVMEKFFGEESSMVSLILLIIFFLCIIVLHKYRAGRN